MILVPVIDLKSGTVVHAAGGARASYEPVRSRLCPGSAPVEVIEAFMRLHPFETVYAADLDAIEGTGDNRAALAEIRKRFPRLDLWVDEGLATPAAFDSFRARHLARAVAGSESLMSAWAWRQILDRAKDDVVLSLDFRGRKFLGPAPLAGNAVLWPKRVIVMSLARVGSKSGPDYLRLAAVVKRAQGREVFAAGGVRNAADLRRLAEMGLSGALVASALHDGRLGAGEFANFMRVKQSKASAG